MDLRPQVIGSHCRAGTWHHESNAARDLTANWKTSNTITTQNNNHKKKNRRLRSILAVLASLFLRGHLEVRLKQRHIWDGDWLGGKVG